MPTADKKGPRKAKKGATEKVPPPPIVNISVRDCMVWPEPQGKGQKTANRGTMSDSKPSAYHSTLVHRDKTADDEGHWRMNVPPPPRREDGTAIEALRGWPGSREQAEETAREYEITARESYISQMIDPKTSTGKNNNNSKKKGKKDTSKKEEDDNVFMGDIIHQRFLNEHLEKRRREMEREQRKKEASLSAAKAGRRAAIERSSNIKANRASQLRAIALADKVETSPLDLWKMPRFTKGVNPHLATAPGGGAAIQSLTEREAAYEASNGFIGGLGCDGGCYCEANRVNYVDENEDGLQGCDSPMAAM